MGTDGSPLVMTLAAVPPLSASDGTARVSVVVTNGSGAPVSATTSPHPNVVLVRDGREVTAPVGARSAGVELELAPGEGRAFTATVSLRARSSGEPGPPVEPGAYHLCAAQVFLVRDAAHPDGYPLEVRGGPWEVVLG